MRMKSVIILFLILFAATQSRAQKAVPDTTFASTGLKFKTSALIAPSALILYGVIGQNNKHLQKLNYNIRDRFTEKERHTRADDYLQYTPMLAVYGLNALGIKGKHNFTDRTVILATAWIISGSTVQILKNTTEVMRPDGSAPVSFPSGHTATAFMAAEFLYQEYKDVSVWYGVAGYTVAAATGYLRMYNNRHWLTDVATGAGIGILSTKIAYWVHPVIKKTFFKNKNEASACVLPYFNGDQLGLALSMKL